MSLPVAVQLYSVRDDFGADMRGTLEQVKAMGYDGVEFAGLYGKPVAELRAMLDEIGLVAVSAHVPIDEMLGDVDRVLDDYAALGCRYIAMPWLADERRPGNPRYEETLEQIAMLGKAAHARGMQLLYHNHDFEFVKVGEEYALDIMYANIPAEYLQTQLDTCWVKVAGEDPAAYVRKYSGRAPLVHLKDFFKKGTEKPANMYGLIGTDAEEVATDDSAEFELRPLGYGVQDVPALLEASLAAGAEWVIVEQDSPAKGQTPMQSVRISRETLRRLGW